MTHRASRNSLAGGLIDVFSALVPLLFVLFGPPLLVFFTLKTPLSKREARKTLATWRLETDLGMETKDYLCRSAKSHDCLRDRRYILFHPVSASRSYRISLMQTMREKNGNLYPWKSVKAMRKKKLPVQL